MEKGRRELSQVDGGRQVDNPLEQLTFLTWGMAR